MAVNGYTPPELHNKYRPRRLEDMVGQGAAVAELRSYIKDNKIPHALAFVGGTGVGKTTAARIMRKYVGCGESDLDYVEINAAESRGIDTIREIQDNMHSYPVSGETRMYVFDECFHAGTLVDTPQGSVKISKLSPGDVVFNLAGTGTVKNIFLNKVYLDRVVKVRFNDGTVVFCSKEHLFRTESGWTEAYRLRVGESFICRSVESVEIYQQGSNDEAFIGVVGDSDCKRGYVEFYDIEVDTNHSYFVHGIPVHNCHRLTPDAQAALLKTLEDTSPIVYFVLATTDFQKLLPAIRTRCTRINFNNVHDDEVRSLLERVAGLEKVTLPLTVQNCIIEAAAGSPRMALNLMGKCLCFLTEQEQLQAVRAYDIEAQGIDLARLLMKKGVRWAEVAEMLSKITGDAESIRHKVVCYGASILLKGKEDPRAYDILNTFDRPIMDSGKPGMAILTMYCFDMYRK